MKIAVLLLAVLLASCTKERTPEQKAVDNQMALDHPDVVGRLPDGRTLYHSAVLLDGMNYAHHIYYAGSDLTVNVGGKAPTARVLLSEPKNIVIIDGQHYDADEVKQALVRDEDQRRKGSK
jgi:hypothetical protein